MTSQQRHSDLPRLFKAAQVAEALECSEWWVKEQARRGRIPFIKSGSGYRFTKAHVEEIFLIFEQRPEQAAGQSAPASPRRRSPAATAAVVPLRARPPRRKRSAA
ncbi:helix-turn-helix domain-containing protein [Streptomyces sp. NPDC048172]|uniref:helix-turn-helix domain-containing protein n=1 Tax=Streptomyces sp. NPDC048172 TaxID=3365505 RepID=UPI00371E4B3E